MGVWRPLPRILYGFAIVRRQLQAGTLCLSRSKTMEAHEMLINIDDAFSSPSAPS